MGLRISDEFNPRDCSYLSPAETIKAVLVKICKDAFGLTLDLIDEKIRYEKRNHFYDLIYQQSGISRSILCFCEDLDDKFSTLEPCYLIAGFLYGVLRTVPIDLQRWTSTVRSHFQRPNPKERRPST